jgi:hypothetical protein
MLMYGVVNSLSEMGLSGITFSSGGVWTGFIWHSRDQWQALVNFRIAWPAEEPLAVR